ncbi:RNA-guided endonuclease IscB [Streptomyces sp. NPDC005865]|uniref:RNA-guided endonuclease IscB n=1 Tax=Streptomyces sp. NPDC005865 TaxID=3155453 RepID=UPI0033CE186E
MLATDGKPLMPCHPARARELLAKGRAVVVRQVPFVIRLKDRTYEEAEVEGVQLRIDPGSKGTGIALTDEKRELDGAGREVTVRRGLVSWEVRHRGDQIQHGLTRRRGYRHRRRSANCRYRAPRSENRRRPDGWLAPSLQHRVDTTHSMARRLFRHAPITEIHVDTARFDTHSLSVGRQLRGAEHQLGPLTGTDARTYLYARWGKSCVYCGATDVALNLDHIHPRGRNGTGRVANLVPSCGACNRRKGSRRVGEYLGDEPERLARIREQTSPPLRDAAVMNSVTARLVCVLRTLGSPVLTWPGRETAATRIAMGLEKSHTLDALCVGALNHERGDVLARVPARTLVVKAVGRGSYARTTSDRFGFPRLLRSRTKEHFGFVTGDTVRATIPSGKWAGVHQGRVAVRARGQHSLLTPAGRINVSHAHLRLLQRGDGYAYGTRRESTASGSEKTG